MNGLVENSLIVQPQKTTIQINFLLLLIIFLVILLGIFSCFQIFNNSADSSAKSIAETNTATVAFSTPENNYNLSNIYIPEHNLHQLSNYFVPKQINNPQETVKSIYFSNEKQIFLTFDDGPSNTVTPLILEILKQYNINATFFVLGNNVDKYPHLVKQAFENGNYIANHGYSHTYSSIYADPQNVIYEFEQTELSIKNALSNQNYNSYLFRFPGGSSGGHYNNVKLQARHLLTQRGIAYTNWNCLTSDSAGAKTREEMLNSLFSTAGNQNSLIVLMHDAQDKKVTAEVLPEIIEHYLNEGYQFKTFYDIFK